MTEDDYFPVILGFGSTHDLRESEDSDPRNPRLCGLKSVSRAGAIGLAKAKAKPPAGREIGFKIPRAKR